MEDPDDPFAQFTKDIELDSSQKQKAKNILDSKKYIPHTYMVAQCSASSLCSLVDHSPEKLGKIMMKILKRAIEHTPYTQEYDYDTMQNMEVVDTQFSNTIQEMYAQQPQNDCIVIGNTQTDISTALGILPQRVIAYLR